MALISCLKCSKPIRVSELSVNGLCFHCWVGSLKSRREERKEEARQQMREKLEDKVQRDEEFQRIKEEGMKKFEDKQQAERERRGLADAPVGERRYAPGLCTEDPTYTLAVLIKAGGFVLSVMGLVSTVVFMTTTTGLIMRIRSVLGIMNPSAKMDTGVLVFFSWVAAFVICLIPGLVLTGFGEIVQAAYKYNRERL